MASLFDNLMEQTKSVVNNVSSVATAAIAAANKETKIITCDTAKSKESCTALFNTQNIKCVYNNDDKCVPCFGLNNTLCMEPCTFNNTTNTCS